MIIYKCTNKLTGKVYVGKTTTDLNSRLKQHIDVALYYPNRRYKWVNALRKYKITDLEEFLLVFDVKVIDSAETQEDLGKKEVYWIAMFNSYKKGYNSTTGESTSGFRHSDESKNKMSLSKQGRYNGVKNPKARSVCQYSLDGQLINTWSFMSEAAKHYGIDPSSITKACKGKLPSYKGFVWRYSNE